MQASYLAWSSPLPDDDTGGWCTLLLVSSLKPLSLWCLCPGGPISLKSSLENRRHCLLLPSIRSRSDIPWFPLLACLLLAALRVCWTAPSNMDSTRFSLSMLFNRLSDSRASTRLLSSCPRWMSSWITLSYDGGGSEPLTVLSWCLLVLGVKVESDIHDPFVESESWPSLWLPGFHDSRRLKWTLSGNSTEEVGTSEIMESIVGAVGDESSDAK